MALLLDFLWPSRATNSQQTRSFTNGVGIRSLEVRRWPTAGTTWQIYSMQTATIDYNSYSNSKSSHYLHQQKGNKFDVAAHPPLCPQCWTHGHAWRCLLQVVPGWCFEGVGQACSTGFHDSDKKNTCLESRPNDSRFLFRNLREVLHQVQSHMRRCNPGQDQIVKQICCVLPFY